jgi:hypothetical protein
VPGAEVSRLGLQSIGFRSFAIAFFTVARSAVLKIDFFTEPDVRLG